MIKDYKQARRNMIERYRLAYRMLRVKDFLTAIHPDIRNIAIVLMLFTALAAINSDMAIFVVVGAVALLATVATLAIGFFAKRCMHKIAQLGFSEVELEASLASVE